MAKKSNTDKNVPTTKTIKEIVLEALRKIEAKDVVVVYSGSGDSGMVEDVNIPVEPGSNINVDKIKVTIPRTSSTFKDGAWVRTVENREVSLPDALREYCYDLLEEYHPGWEINEGSDGTLEIDPHKGEIYWKHATNIVTQEIEEREL